MKSMKMGMDWSEFQPELLQIIANKLTIYIDYVRFRVVCVKWRSSVSPKPHHLPTQLPWLLFPYTSENGTDHCFLDLSTNKFHELSLMVSRESRCCGSSQGWLVFVEECSPSIRLVNPLTRNVIHLPPLTSHPNVLDFNILNLGNECLYQEPWRSTPSTCSKTIMRDYFINKVVLSSSPNSLENDYIALLILSKLPGLAFHKKGVEEWSIIEVPDFYEDAIYYNGSIYAINYEGSILICDISGVSPIVTLITVAESHIFLRSKAYLVDSFGELMLVTINKEVDDNEFDSDHDDEYHSVNESVLHFSVFNYDSSKPEWEWTQMDTLVDHMLFLGGHSSVCLSASDFSGCERNCIYFSCDTRFSENRQYDFGVYHWDDSSIVPFPFPYGLGGSTQYSLPPPIWVTPNPC